MVVSEREAKVGGGGSTFQSVPFLLQQHYPSTEKYISLYPTTETTSAKAEKRRGMYLYLCIFKSHVLLQQRNC